MTVSAPIAARFRIERLLGQGSLGKVFLAREQDKPIALKVLREDLPPATLEFLREEARVLSRLSHPNLVKILDFFPGDAGASACIVMEFLDGETLDRLSEDCPMEQWEDIVLQTCQGLDYLHHRNILHHDLKPSNLLLTRSGQIKILDFSLATPSGLSRRTAAIRGTLPFLPPEIFSGLYDERSDLFALGVVFYKLLSGKFPYSEILRPERLGQIGSPSSPRLSRPLIPEYLEALLLKLLSLDPRHRPGSVRTVLRYLRNHREGLEAQPAERQDLPIEKLPLIGRQREWEALQDHLSGDSRMVLLNGPTGVGRSRLLEELRWKHLLQGDFFRQQGPPSETGWLEFPEDEATPGDAYAKAEACAIWLQGRKGILAYTELHRWNSLELADLEVFLKVLSRRHGDLGIVLEWDSDHMRKEALFRKSPELLRDAREIRLNDLDEASTLILLTEFAAGTEIAPKQLADIARISGGRPLLALENLKAFLADRAESDVHKIHWAIPKSLEEASFRRYQGLGEAAKRLLSFIVLAPRDPERHEIEEFWDGEVSKLDAALAELDRKEWLRSRSPLQPKLSLRYPSLRAGLSKFFESQAGTAVWRTWAEYFERTWRAAAREEDLFHLITCAQEGGFQDLLIAYAFEAIPRLERRSLYERAIALTEVLCRLPDGAVDPVLLHAHRANLFYRLDRFADSLRAYEQWFRVRADDESKLQLTKYLFYTGLVNYSWGHSENAMAALERCLKAGDASRFPKLLPYQARAYLLLARLAQKVRAYSLAQEHLDRARKLPLEDAEILGEIEQVSGEICLHELRYDEALSRLEACQAHYQATGRPQLMALGHGGKAAILQERGRLREALKEIESAISQAEASGYRAQRARYLGNRALLLSELGRYAEARETMQQSLAVLQVLGNPTEQAIAKIQWMQIQLDCGKTQNLQHAFAELAEDLEALDALNLVDSLMQLRGEAALQYRDYGLAKNIFERLLGRDRRLDVRARRIALWGRWRAQFLAGWTDVPFHEAEEDFANGTVSPQDEAIRNLSRFLSSDPRTLSRETALQVFSSLEGIESIGFRLTCHYLLKVFFDRHGLEGLLAQTQTLEDSLWRALSASQPEEIKMDIENKRSLFELNEDLKKPLQRAAQEEAVGVKSASLPPPVERQAARISEERFRQFCEITNRVAQKEVLTEILELLMDSSLLLTGAERGFVILENAKSKDGKFPGFEVAMARHLSRQALAEEEFKLSLTLVRKAIQGGSPVLSRDAQAEDEFHKLKSVHLYQLRSVLVVPLEIAGRVFGALYLDHRYKTDCFGTEDLLLIKGFATQAGLAIQRAQMMEALKKKQQRLENQVSEQAQTIESLHLEIKEARSHLKYEYQDIVGNSPAIMQVFRMMEHVTKTKIPVWIWGESGTGKELFARSLHFNSPWKSGPFVSENCSSIPENLLESELFGHKKGAFTHADRDRVGLFEQADRGTLFLDEVADMPLPMQIKLLRVLQEGEIRPLGSNKKVKVDVRLVTASNKDLAQLVREGKFREDLFYRINGLTLRLPPLRERREDIPDLVQHLIQRVAKRFFLKPCKVTKEAFHMLMKHDWPGNVRQLEGIVRNAMMFADGEAITPAILKMTELAVPSTSPAQPAAGPLSGRRKGDESESERAQLIEALRRHSMDKNKVAQELGITLKSVYVRMERHGIPKKNSLLMKFLTEAS